MIQAIVPENSVRGEMIDTKKTNTQTEQGGWCVSESILTEIDIALSHINEYWDKHFWLKQVRDMTENIPEDFIDDFKELGLKPKMYIRAFSRIAIPLGLIGENNYKKATLAIRKLDFETLCDKIYEWFSSPPANDRNCLDLKNRLIDTYLNDEIKVLKAISLEYDKVQLKELIRSDIELLSRILRGGELEYDFWHWLDRFFYEFYQPWRQTQQEIQDKQKKEALKHLGKLEENSDFPKIEWLLDRIALTAREEVIDGIKSMNSFTHFIISPLEFYDFNYIQTGYICLSVGKNNWESKEYTENVEKISQVTKALSDPTRLLILRLIRYSGLYTTEMASTLKLSRPTISEHCKILRKADLIETYQVGRKSFHKLKPENVKEHLRQLLHFLDLH